MSINTKFSSLTNDEWLSVMQRSVREPYIENCEFPRFPHSSIQLGYNGAADEEGLLRAHAFWQYAEHSARLAGRPIDTNTRILDLGCGWGRITRMFSRDTPAQNIYGVDIDPNAITICQYLGVPGQFTLTKAGAALPFPDGFFNIIVASSVFSHLPESVATPLITEMHRVSVPGALFIFTVEDEQFLDNLEIPGIESASDRWRLLSRYKADLTSLRERAAVGEYLYLTTNEEEFRSADVYGDAVIPKTWIKKNWDKYFKLLEFVGSAPPVYQAVVVGMRK